MAWTEAQLAKVEAAIEARLDGGGVESYGIGDRNLKYLSLKELRDLRREMKNEIEQARGGRISLATFGRAR